MDGALEEARISLKDAPLNYHDTLILYSLGLGLGYQYLVLKDWLQGNPKKVFPFIHEQKLLHVKE
jgi:hypothetical protein